MEDKEERQALLIAITHGFFPFMVSPTTVEITGSSTPPLCPSGYTISKSNSLAGAAVVAITKMFCKIS
jgi:hypothetical protein